MNKLYIVIVAVVVFVGGFFLGRQFPTHRYVQVGNWVTDTATGKSHQVDREWQQEQDPCQQPRSGWGEVGGLLAQQQKNCSQAGTDKWEKYRVAPSDKTQK